MTITDPTFEAAHPRAAAGKFTTKTNDAPATPLIDGHEAQVAPYADEPIAGRTEMPTEPSEQTMAMGDDQAGLVWTFAEEHRLADGRYLSSIQYVYPAYASETEFTIVTETEQFVSAEPHAYEATAHLVREGSTWNRYDSAALVCSPERAATMAKRAAEDAHLHQSYFTSTVPWTGEPLADTAAAFRESSALLNGE
ncbi:MAG: hypothetical protein J0J04_07645 [Microbacterium sp.]|uniref:hypothetical protein n=1 Tax=Microbacterium sp. TaxID=51671 RepID=UPI001AC7FEFF|nr:hypothetical protein [Microbacterium sp.]MBN9214671.1 hypothetical protein [Microbacterium sp.]